MDEVMKMSILYSARPDKKDPAVLCIDEENEKVTVNGETCELTHQEYCLLCCLAKAQDRILSRDELLKTAWGYLSPGMTRTVDVHVQRLRRKLGSTSIETVYRIGYRLCVLSA